MKKTIILMLILMASTAYGREYKYCYSLADNTVCTSIEKSVHNQETEACFTQEGLVSWDLAKIVISGAPGAPVASLKSAGDITAIVEAREKAANKARAEALQDESINLLIKNDAKIARGLPPVLTDAKKVEYESFIQQLQGDIDNPQAGVYNPPLPPGVVAPEYDLITVKVTREEGWAGHIGYRAVIASIDEDFTPGSLSLGVYAAANCTTYQFTTGAFQWDAVGEEWYAVCPPGFEPEQSEVHFSVLYGAANLACFTLPENQQEIFVNAYQE
jgi:hypothetical protein